MTHPDNWNSHDTPVTCKEKDQFGMWPFAESLAKGLKDMQDPEGFTVVLCGAWGSGKSSVIGMVREELAADKDRVHVSEFKGWWFRGEEALAVAFLKHLQEELPPCFDKRTKTLLADIANRVLQKSPDKLGSILRYVCSKIKGFAHTACQMTLKRSLKEVLPSEKTLEELFDALKAILKEQNKRFLIIIDDIDRMTPEEALAVFRLVKTVGRLPNVMYLLAYDRELAERMVQQRFPSEGAHYLEKIVQVSYEMPYPLPSDINAMVRKQVNKLCNVQEENLLQDFDVAVRTYLTTPRHAVRYINAIRLTWPAIANEIDLEDFLIMELIRLCDAEVFHEMRRRRSELLIFRNMDEYIKNVPYSIENNWRVHDYTNKSKHGEQSINILSKLLGLKSFSHPSSVSNVRRRRIFHDYSCCDTYFRLTLSDDMIPKDVVDKIIERLGDVDFIKNKMVNVSKEKSRNGQSLAVCYLNEIFANFSAINKECLQGLLSALFCVFDEIVQNSNQGFDKIKEILFRITLETKRELTDNEERSKVILTALESASLGWLTYLSDILLQEIQKKPEDECLVQHKHTDRIRGLALKYINNSLVEKTIYDRGDLSDILRQWYYIEENKENVKKLTNDIIIGANNCNIIRMIDSLRFSDEHRHDHLSIIHYPTLRKKIEELLSSAGLSEKDREYLRGVVGAIPNLP